MTGGSLYDAASTPGESTAYVATMRSGLFLEWD